MMKQFRVEFNQYGNMFIYCRDVYFYGGYLERMVCLKQWNGQENRYE
jgi:hypothetical protein